MYCPQCATEFESGAEFCRGCGVSVALVPASLRGGLSKPHQSIISGFTTMGSAAILLGTGPEPSTFGLVIGSSLMATGLGFLAFGAARLRRWRRRRTVPAAAAALAPGPTNRLGPPPSVVEDTTRRIEDVPTRRQE